MRPVLITLFVVFLLMAAGIGLLSYDRLQAKHDDCIEWRINWLRAITSSTALNMDPDNIDQFVNTDATLGSMRRTSERSRGLFANVIDANSPDLSMQLVILVNGMQPNVVAKAGATDISSVMTDLPPSGTSKESQTDKYILATYPVSSSVSGFTGFVQATYPVYRCANEARSILKLQVLMSAFILCASFAFTMLVAFFVVRR